MIDKDADEYRDDVILLKTEKVHIQLHDGIAQYQTLTNRALERKPTRSLAFILFPLLRRGRGLLLRASRGSSRLSCRRVTA